MTSTTAKHTQANLQDNVAGKLGLKASLRLKGDDVQAYCTAISLSRCEFQLKNTIPLGETFTLKLYFPDGRQSEIQAETYEHSVSGIFHRYSASIRFLDQIALQAIAELGG